MAHRCRTIWLALAAGHGVVGFLPSCCTCSRRALRSGGTPDDGRLTATHPSRTSYSTWKATRPSGRVQMPEASLPAPDPGPRSQGTASARVGWFGPLRPRAVPVNGSQDREFTRFSRPYGCAHQCVPDALTRAIVGSRALGDYYQDQWDGADGGRYNCSTASSMSPPPTSTGSMYKRPAKTRPSRNTRIVIPRIANGEPSAW